jgi:hypothetical protein
MKSRAAIAVALWLAIPSWAFGAEAGAYSFTVLSDGRPIGSHRIVFEHEGDRVEIQEETDIEVSFAAVPLYTFEHQAHQLWRNGRAVRIDAITNDNGERLDITVRDTAVGYVRTVNGRVDRFDEQTTVLALWNKDTFDHDAYFSAVEDKVLNASFEYVGKESIIVAGRRLQTQHYRMFGDEEHELWYDPAGHLAKVAFRRYGTTIEYVRDQVEPAAPNSICAANC